MSFSESFTRESAPSSLMGDPIEEQWEVNSQAFADLIGGTGTPHHQDILVPCLDRLVGDVTGKELLDAGCGEGYLSRRYAEKGAIVTGVDISSRLIDFCKLHAMENTSFSVGDICNLNERDGNSFDVVLCNVDGIVMIWNAILVQRQDKVAYDRQVDRQATAHSLAQYAIEHV